MGQAKQAALVPTVAGWHPASGWGAGILAGLGAGAFWGMTFVAPLAAPGFSGLDLTIGRYIACAVFSLLWLLVSSPGSMARLDPSATPQAQPRAWWWWALGLSVLGYTGYYLLLVLGVEAMGPAMPVLIIGTLPVWMMLLGKPEGMQWRNLAVGLCLTIAGLSVMGRSTLSETAAGPLSGPNPLMGVLLAVAAMLSWLAFGFLNARWLQRHPGVSSTVWANWMGVAAGVGALGLWAGWGSSLSTLMSQPGFERFVLVCVVTGIGSGWLASVLWNMASRRLAASLAGQLIVSETVFGLCYAFGWSGLWPTSAQWVAAMLFVGGILSSIRAHR